MRDILFYNGKIHTMNSETDVKSYMIVSDDRIKAIGKGVPKGRYKRIDLQGKHIYPCLIDSHVHMLLTIAVMAMGFNICEITKDGVEPNTILGIEEKIREYVKDKPKKKIIAMNGYILSSIDEGRMPNKDELDLWGEGRPIIIYNIDGHSTALSSSMLKKLKIDPSTTNGVLQGEDNERVQGRITDLIASQIGLKELAKGIATFQNTCASYGICMVGALEGNGDSEKDSTTNLLVKFAKHFDIDVKLFLQYFDVNRVMKFEHLMKDRRIGGCGDWEMDGAVGAHSSSMSIPFKDTNTYSDCYYTEEEVDDVVRECFSMDYQIISHAIGDRAIDRILSSYEKYHSNRINRIEHCEFLTDSELKRIAKNNIAVSMQPGYAWIDKRYLKTYEKFLDEVVVNRMKLKSIYDKGILLCGSSDSPVQDLDPYLQMLGMVDFYKGKESLSNYEAFKTYTVYPAKFLGEEENYGTLNEGSIASFFTSKEDFFSIGKDEVVSFRPEETYIKGKKYRVKSENVMGLILSLFTKSKLL